MPPRSLPAPPLAEPDDPPADVSDVSNTLDDQGDGEPEADGEEASAMSAALATTTSPIPIPLRSSTDLERRMRVQQALSDGTPVASADMRDGEYFTMLHRGMFAILASARRLSSNEHAFLYAYLAHSHSRCAYAVVDVNGTTPPKLEDWGHWLGGLSKQQIYAIREALHAKRIIRYVNDNPRLVALNPSWEEWDGSVFQPNTAKANAGRKGGQAPKGIQDIHNSEEGEEATCEEESKAPALLGDEVKHMVDEASSSSFTLSQSYALPASSSSFTSAVVEGSPTADAAPPPRRKTAKRQKTIPANAGGAADADAPGDVTTPPSTASSSTTTYPQPQGWLERAQGEGDQAYFARVIPQCKNVPAAVAYAAYLKLGIAPTRETIQRLSGVITMLKREYGDAQSRWGVVVRAILRAATMELDDDPLNYVHTVARELAKREVAAQAGRSGQATMRSVASNAASTPTTHAAVQTQRRQDRRYRGSQEYWEDFLGEGDADATEPQGGDAR